MSSQPSLEDLIRMARRGRVRPSLKPMRSHTGFIFVPIENSKPSCVACGDDVPKGRHFTCSIGCQKRETLRVKEMVKRRKEAQIPKMSLGGRVKDALGGLFG